VQDRDSDDEICHKGSARIQTSQSICCLLRYACSIAVIAWIDAFSAGSAVCRALGGAAFVHCRVPSPHGMFLCNLHCHNGTQATAYCRMIEADKMQVLSPFVGVLRRYDVEVEIVPEYDRRGRASNWCGSSRVPNCQLAPTVINESGCFGLGNLALSRSPIVKVRFRSAIYPPQNARARNRV